MRSRGRTVPEDGLLMSRLSFLVVTDRERLRLSNRVVLKLFDSLWPNRNEGGGVSSLTRSGQKPAIEKEGLSLRQ